MLLQMRSFTRSWVSYLLLFILSMLFVVFLGNGQSLIDTFQATTSNQFASGRGVSIGPRELNREFENALRQKSQEEPGFDREQAIESGMHLQSLERLIRREAIFSYIDRLGVSVSDGDLDAAIAASPEALSPVTGAYDPSILSRRLSEAGFSYDEYRSGLRGEMSADMFLRATLEGARAPSSFGALALIAQTEQRVVTIAEAPASALGVIAPPTEAELQTYWEESQAQLRVPEFRVLTLVVARAQDFAARVEIPEERLEAEVEARRAAAVQPERRSYVRISAPTEALAREAAARLGRGESPDAIAASLGAGVQATRGENQARADVPDAPVAEAVFAMAVRGPPRVARGRLSWAAVRVESKTDPVEPNLAEIRQQARQAIANDGAGELMEAAMEAFDDARAGGAPIAEAARQNGLAVTTSPPIEARGRGQDGRPIPALADKRELMAAAFETTEGEGSEFLPVGEDSVVVGVDRVIPASVRPLAEVHDELAQNWIAQARGRRLRELGEQIVAEIRGGRSLTAVAAARRMRMLLASAAVDRGAASPGANNAPPRIPSEGLLGQIFSAREGAVMSDRRGDGGAVLVAVLENIRRVDPAAQPRALEENRMAMQQSLQGSFGSAVQSEMIARANVTRQESRIAQAFGGAASEDGEGAQ